MPDFYRWLGEDSIAVPDLPGAWICGDCHLGNIGPVADNDGGVDIQIRDLDQTLIGNPAHDILRLGLSLVTAARSSILPGVSTAAMIDALVTGFREGVQAIVPIVPCSKAPPSDNAIRVVEGARHLSPNLGDRMISATLMGRTVVIRELKPQDLKLEVEQFSTRQAERAAHYLGHVVGHAHGRQLGKADRKALQSAFVRRRAGGAVETVR